MLVTTRGRVATAAIVVAITALASSTSTQTRVRVWVDTDPAIGEPERDVDDGFALVQAFRSPEIQIRGISVVFGNAPLDQGLSIARRIAGSSARRLSAYSRAPRPPTHAEPRPMPPRHSPLRFARNL